MQGGGVWPLTLWNFNESPSLLSPSLSVAAILSGPVLMATYAIVLYIRCLQV